MAEGNGKDKASYRRGILTGLLVAVVVVYGYVFVTRRTKQPNVNDNAASYLLKHTPRPVLTKLVEGEIIIKAGQYRYWTFTVDSQSMLNVHVFGWFHASGGSGNDIQAVLAEASEFENWINGHAAKVFYSTEKTTNGKFDVPLMQGGTYILAFSNKFSALTDKEVTAEVQMRYLALPPQVPAIQK